jgi:hypothetical protein
LNRYAHWFAIAWTVLVTAFLLFGPIYPGDSSVGPDGTVASLESRRTLWQVNGFRALVALAFPLMFVAAPLMVKDAVWRRHTLIFATILMWGLVLLGGFSIGLFYMPTALAMLLLVLTSKRQEQLPAQQP